MSRVTKQDRILSVLKAGIGLNRFEAEGHGDHVLPSTICALRGKGYSFIAIPEHVPSRYGRPVRCMRYHFVGMI